jgi:pantoate--beta-alanine ligase
MITVHSIQEIQDFIHSERSAGKKIGFVPTMGALHEGHISLVHAAKHHGLSCVMSIFVNPTQFGPNEDFSKYPRSLETDKNLALTGGVSALFTPSQEAIYPNEHIRYIDPPRNMNEVLCGPFRPGHFRGVCTVVNRLLEIIQPDELFLGQKDAQQLRILQITMKEQHPKINIVGVPTVREKSGLAMSSRNKYLSNEEKNKASIIYKALSETQSFFKLGEKNTQRLLEFAKKILNQEPDFKIQYLELVQWNDFQNTETIEEKSLLAIAGFLGQTRLIDNIFLD